MKDWHWLIIIALVILLLRQQKVAAENDESWSIRRDDRGRLIGIEVHRKAQ